MICSTVLGIFQRKTLFHIPHTYRQTDINTHTDDKIGAIGRCPIYHIDARRIVRYFVEQAIPHMYAKGRKVILHLGSSRPHIPKKFETFSHD